MKFKKIYIELSDICGLKCDFCPSKKGMRGIMDIKNFQKIAPQLSPKAKIFTFHVLGDPLLIPNLEDYLKIAQENHMKLEITTSGFYMNERNQNLLLKFENIHQINFSLVAFLDQNTISLENYFKNILIFCSKHLQNKSSSFINLRLWNLDIHFNPPAKNDIIYNFLENHFKTSIPKNQTKIRLNRHILLHQSRTFKWPNINDKALYKEGKCHALKEQIGILSNGTLVPCCLDTQAHINLGNIFQTSFEKLLHSSRLQAMKEAFKNNQRIENLCQKCEFFKIRDMPE